MKRISKQTKNYTLPLSFAIPFLGILAVMIVCGDEPFGNSSLLYSDNYHQYYPFFHAFREALRSGDSLLWSWNVGMGMDYLGLISYYLASPLNLLSAIVPDAWVLEYYSILLPIRLGLAGLFFAVFLKHTCKREDLSVALFSACYALCAWALGYQWNVMWLDTFALTPLVVLGTVQVLEKRKFILYTVTLFLAVYSNYYIGFFVCIFVMLVCICWEICRWKGVRHLFCDIGLMLFLSVLAIGMTAVLELPALAALQNTQSSVNEFPTGFDINMGDDTWLGLLDAMRQVAGNMGGGTELTYMEGLPNLYCGVGMVALAILFLMARGVKLRDKICAVAMLLFLMFSFIIRQLDYIWHGFHFTNQIPYRFSFLYSFVILYMAYRAWTLRRSFRMWQVFLAAGVEIALLALNDSRTDMPYIIYNGNLLLLYVFFASYVLCRKRPAADMDVRERRELKKEQLERRRKGVRFLAVTCCAELVITLVSFGIQFSGNDMSFYPRGKEHAESMIRYMHEREVDTLFYRAETTHSQTLNDGALNGYHGISAFTSSANVKVTEFMRSLGYGAKNTYNRYCYEEGSPVSDLFLGIKYMIDREGRDRESSIYEHIHTYGSVSLLQNSAYLPLGFLAERELGDMTFDYDNDFYFQNELFASATGLSQRVWHPMEADTLEIIGNDVNVSDQYGDGYITYSDAIDNSSVSYFYTADREGFFCVQLDCPKRNSVTILLNDFVVMEEDLSLEQMLAVGDVVPGDRVELRFDCEEGEDGSMTVGAAILDGEIYWKGWETLSASTLELTEFSNTRVAGEISCGRDGLLYTSIPQNGNWSATVDGEEAEIVPVGDVMVAVELAEGDHEVVFTYHNAAFALGWKISLLSFVIFAALVYFTRKPRRKGKFEAA